MPSVILSIENEGIGVLHTCLAFIRKPTSFAIHSEDTLGDVHISPAEELRPKHDRVYDNTCNSKVLETRFRQNIIMVSPQ